MEELERTYLLKYFPKDLERSEKMEIVDVYIPRSASHPVLRIRKRGDHLRITKKEPFNKGDASHQKEQTIVLAENEFKELVKLDGKKVRKIRYYYKYNSCVAEIDVFQDQLRGLVVADFEFGTLDEKLHFQAPDFCLVNVTQEKFIAGGMLCGKQYGDIEEELKRFDYSKLLLE